MMESGWQLQAAFVLWTLSLSKAQDVVGPGLTCLRSTSADGQTRVTFLLEDPAGALSLFLTVWSEDMRLVTCQIYTNSRITEVYRAHCDTTKSQHREMIQKFDISMVMAPDVPCVLVSSWTPEFTNRTRGDGAERKARRKRWVFPGTLWCGSGSKAVGYEQLGMFEGADRCCREHDHCPHIIPAFTVNYGVFNPNFFTVSHCECDQRFRQCLLGTNDSISHMVGYSFFNLLQVSCFELKQLKRCTEMYWFGMCKVAKEAPYAVFQSPLPYNNSDGISKYADIDSNNLSREKQNLTKSAMASPQRKLSNPESRCLKDPPRGDTFHRKRTKGRGCKKHQKLSGAATTQVPNLLRGHATTLPMKMGYSKSRILMSNKKTAGKRKSIGKGLSGLEQSGHVPISVPTNSDLQSTSTTPSSIPPLTLGLKLQPDPTTAFRRGTKTSKRNKKVPKQSHCCGSSMLLRGDTYCKHCQKPEAASYTTVTPAKTATSGLSTKQRRQHPKKTTERPNQDTQATPVTFSAPVITKLRTTTALPEDGKPQWNNTSQGHFGPTIAQCIHAEKSLKQNRALQNITDNQLQCRSLKHLDDCEFQIPPLGKKYNLQNMESKTVYHCDCTSRLAIQIESFRQLPSISRSLLVEFVSQQCFTLPKKKKCHHKKRCSTGFTKAFDLHRALKKIGEKGTADMRISAIDRKRRIPASLYKRCLKLERGADTHLK
ncbi:uncharacterized protein [Leuresthes tenuis]|uniref:uncharacterized protein n=1 Tax=Leuresthes tenuis TaxID=355514 RepID=UPI003B500BC7